MQLTGEKSGGLTEMHDASGNRMRLYEYRILASGERVCASSPCQAVAAYIREDWDKWIGQTLELREVISRKLHQFRVTEDCVQTVAPQETKKTEIR